jgi:hypothetical protein
LLTFYLIFATLSVVHGRPIRALLAFRAKPLDCLEGSYRSTEAQLAKCVGSVLRQLPGSSGAQELQDLRELTACQCPSKSVAAGALLQVP